MSFYERRLAAIAAPGRFFRSKKLCVLLAVLTATLTWSSFTAANDKSLFSTFTPQPPTASAKSYLLVDFQSGTVLAKKRVHERSEAASLTKLVTALVVYRALESGLIALEDQVRISARAQAAEGSRMFLEAGSLVSVKDLITGMVVQSGNDATVALAEHVAGSVETFATLMNQEAKQLGMHNSHFENPSGLPHPNHYMSAWDIMLAAHAVIAEFPEQYALYSLREFTYNDIRQHNRNKLLLRGDGVDGLKTGYTEKAGWCLAASADRGGMRLISVVLGGKNKTTRLTDTSNLLNYGFRFFKTVKLYGQGQEVHKARIRAGSQEYVNLGLVDDLYVTIPRALQNKLKVRLLLPEDLYAPIALFQTAGTVRVSLGSETIKDTTLVALSEVEEGNMLRQIQDYFFRWFK